VQKDMLLLTGWGATCTVWEPIIPALSECFQINCITPSWLDSETVGASLCDVDDYIEKLASQIHKPVNLVAWSMGGLLAIRLAARVPNLIQSVCFISSVPKFVCANNENAGIDFDWFNNFVSQYQQDSISTLNKFLTLQVKNDAYARPALRLLKNACVFEEYPLVECACGLKLLQQQDLSEQLMSLQCKKIFIHGGRDAVVSIQAAQNAAFTSKAQIYLVPNAGHAPHVSHPNVVAEHIKTHLC